MAKFLLLWALLAVALHSTRGLTLSGDGFFERKPGSSLLLRRHLSGDGEGEQTDGGATTSESGQEGEAAENSDAGGDEAEVGGEEGEGGEEAENNEENGEGQDSENEADAQDQEGEAGQEDQDAYDVAPEDNYDQDYSQDQSGAEEPPYDPSPSEPILKRRRKSRPQEEEIAEPSGIQLDSSEMNEGFANSLAGNPDAEPIKIPPVPTDIDSVTNLMGSAADTIQKVPGASIFTNRNGIFGDFFVGEQSSSDDENTHIDDADFITKADDDALPPNVEQLLMLDLADQGSIEKSYISIASDLKQYENTYIDCMEKYSDLDFTLKAIDACIGHGARYVEDDIEHFKRRLLARADSIMHSRIIENCFKLAGADLVMSAGCDLLLKDALALLWSELNYYALIDYHRNKYTFQHASLPDDVLDQTLAEFKSLYAKQTDLLVELYNHKTLTIQRVRDYVADRMEFIRDMEEENGPLQRAPLSADKIIRVDSAHSKLQELDQLRWEQPWIMFKKDRKMTQTQPFANVWHNDGRIGYGRGGPARGLSQTPDAHLDAKAQATADIEAKINAAL